ncbi:alpha-1,6-mannosyl-glycoprotein 2-beta-N-acetylglucosaminyltransferase isoform X3 [Schistocerca gregaria]|uniref:alpha-1,6-mannosyl-glycoprotein 2-beta-N-acetylglucosaminyltransferase isoform X3 n=1 Tax=Schistocerca gregaria TaxID=7010 RepID=UPI00211ECE56|nr:alpha-1,6-mannosyl-glycoprotein 2-beta-N-acetylglucosaminyltransferase isoform X3 [Schistocerca gregaria]
MRLHYTGRGLRVSMAAPAIGRRRTASCVRTAVFLFLVTFVWLQLHVASLGSARHAAPDAAAAAADANDSTAAILSMVPQVLHKFLTPKPRRNATGAAGAAAAAAGTAANGSAGAAAAGLPVPRPNISDIRRSIERYNEMQTIHNEEVFGPVQNDTLIIVVQVHTRIIYLRHLIVSLAQARDIDTVLLIFSHDYYDEEINELVQSIDFCKVMQIFYPFSIQTHPKEFPGESPGDCPRNIKKEQAKEMMCNNALYPDLYGHYREAKFTQTKHHWWWKANRVFNQLDVTRNHTGMVLFLEEDHFVAEDFIHVMHLMERTCKVSCDRCNILSLGTYLKTYNYYGDSKKAEVTPWVSSKHNMGMAFNRTTWNDIRRCAEFFCIYDDYNWDWSLQHISQGCMAHKLYAMVMKGPRVFHIGECGVHHKKANCESTAVISKVQHVLKFAAKHLYPTHLTLTVTNGNKKQKLRKGNGGWGDIRDHQLCINMTKIGR